MKRVLVPLDRTDHAETALEALKQVCELEDEILLLSIAEPKESMRTGLRPGRTVLGGIYGSSGGQYGVEAPDFPVYAENQGQVIQSQIDELQDYLSARASRLEAAGFSNVHRAAEISENPADAIVDVARRVGPAFVLMVRTSRRSAQKRLFGGTSEHVVREGIPVLVLPGV